MPRISSVCGAVAGPLFVASFLLQGATRDGYDPLRHPVSSLAIGEHGWIQTTTFLVTGALTAVFAVGLRQGLGRLLVGLWALGLIGAGLFTAAPVSGYPDPPPPFD